MLNLIIPSTEIYDEEKNEFIYTKETSLQLEHSLLSISKWESKWHKPFLTEEKKTTEEIIDYVRCMTLTQNVKSETYLGLTRDNLKDVEAYIEDPMTATTFNDSNKTGKNKEIITSEIIYYWMIAQNIPIECQKWHINRLLTLIKVCSIKNDTKPKKMSRKEVMSRNKALNDARRAATGSKG